MSLLLAGVVVLISDARVLAHTDLTVEQARDLIASTADLVVVDVREPSEYCDARGHIPGALNYPLTSGVLQARYAELPMDRPILVVCRSGGRSNVAANFLDAQGFPEVYDMNGGMNAWLWETVPCKYSGGSGTAKDPYQIATAEQLNAIGADPNEWDKHFILIADIDLSAYTGTEFNIIGRRRDYPPDEQPFTGVFDGKSHRIRGFAWHSDNGDFIGLFGYVCGPHAKIKNLGLVGAKVDAGLWNSYVGSLVGYLGEGEVVDCYMEDGSVRGTNQIGGLVGGTREGTLIKNCHTTGEVTGRGRTGGLIGYNLSVVTKCYSATIVSGGSDMGGLAGSNEYAGAIIGCDASGMVTGTSSVGGLVGFNHANITGCRSHVIVTGVDDVGGLVGYNDYGVVSCSRAVGEVMGDSNVGGLMGRNRGGNAYWGITDSYATSSVTGNVNVGGLVGCNSSVVARSYSAGLVVGESLVGGLIGCDTEGNVTASFWDTEVSGLFASAAGEGRTTVEMHTASTFLAAGWDLVDEIENGTEDIWSVEEGSGYPQLIWTEPYGGGTGHPGDPYLIYTAGQLNAIGLNPRHLDKHFVLMADIDLGVYTETGFNIIGGAAPSEGFRGGFEGNGHAISNLSLAPFKRSNVGLFASLYGVGAEVRNLRLIEPRVDAETSYFVGALAGYLYGGTIKNCGVEGALVIGYQDTGGLTGGVRDGTIQNSFSTGRVEGNTYAGGLVGANGSSGTITNCYSQCEVVGEIATGGLAGHNGGVVTTNCYATGEVSDALYTGGFASKETGEITGCFWNAEMSDETSSTAGTGLTTAEMQRAATYLEAGWDFVDETENGTEDIWWIDEGNDYPRLWWEAQISPFSIDD
jgi:rhodanese-related sulfurtransferase